jgi:hypothetical protein
MFFLIPLFCLPSSAHPGWHNACRILFLAFLLRFPISAGHFLVSTSIDSQTNSSVSVLTFAARFCQVYRMHLITANIITTRLRRSNLAQLAQISGRWQLLESLLLRSQTITFSPQKSNQRPIYRIKVTIFYFFNYIYKSIELYCYTKRNVKVY